jgi:ribosomal peptide maturation radical SAM protein 1
MRTLLVSMPFGSLEGPSPAISMLKARLTEQGIDCDVLYASIAFAGVLSPSDYDRIAERMPEISLPGEWVFARCLSTDDEQRDERYMEEVAGRLTPADRDLLLRARAAAPDFLSGLAQSTRWGDYDLIGFASSCAQNAASLALARTIKERHPSVTVVFGGANWEGDMGAALLELFPFVDIAFLGEADDSLLTVLERLDHSGGRTGLADVPGIAYRDGTVVRKTSDAPQVDHLDRLPSPEFGDFFEALCRLEDTPPPADVHLWLQASRGCWWAAREPCRFCGLNGKSRVYRTKSPQRILEEIRTVVAAWEGCQVNLVDTVVPSSFLDEVLPALAADGLGLRLWFEVRPELTREQVRAIAAAGGEVQIGIESLSDHVLGLVGKGSRALEGLRLLKWCEAEGLKYCWNIIYDIPGESDEDYEEMIAMLPALLHLQPPTTCGSMFLDRFSTYHDCAAAYGISGVRVPEAWRYVYPWPEDVLERIAYTFRYDKDREPVRAALIRRLCRDVAAWRAMAGRAELRLVEGRPVRVEERRPEAAPRCVDLDDLDALLYAACDDIGVEEDLVRLACVHTAGHGHSVREEDVRRLVAARLGRLVDAHVLVASGGRYLSMAQAPSSDGTPSM